MALACGAGGGDGKRELGIGSTCEIIVFYPGSGDSLSLIPCHFLLHYVEFMGSCITVVEIHDIVMGFGCFYLFGSH